MPSVMNTQTPSSISTTKQGATIVAIVLGLALFSSGFAGLTNEVVWQRSLKRLLGGSETISSTIVVMVFMGGLGLGAIAMGNTARKAKDPLLWLAGLEGALVVVNLIVAAVLNADLSATVFGAQTAAMALGLPLALFYALGASAVLAIPCLLMGATTPLASEVCQRRLGQTDARVLGLVFFINTFGAMTGCVLGSTTLVPAFGLQAAMFGAAGVNLFAALLLLGLRAMLPASSVQAEDETITATPKRPIWHGSTEEIAALGLGLCALAYEMVLLRVSALVHEPQPATFSMVLVGFLLFWSAGAALGSRDIKISIRATLVILVPLVAAGLFAALNAPQTDLQTAGAMMRFVLGNPIIFLPCVLFGFLFTRIAAAAAKNWGRDVGRVYGWNTVGACSGILLAIFIGFELHLMLTFAFIVVIAMGVATFWIDRTTPRRVPLSAGVILCMMAVLLTPQLTDTSQWNISERISEPGSTRFFFGRSGVVGVDKEGSVYWDGLWHSELITTPGGHIDSFNWWMAAAPVLAHPTGEIHHAAIVGMGTGITAGSLAPLGSLERIDAYEINHTLQQVFDEYPEGTLHSATDKKVNLIWQDARSGLSLNEQRYDVITTAPLYLKQAGAGLLNAVETFEVVRSHLKPGGIACVFSWGTDAQAFVVRQTAAQVFEHHLSIWGGYLLLLSDSPIDMSAATLRTRLATHAGDPLWAQIAEHAGEQIDANYLADIVDNPQFSWGDGRLFTTDDRPIIEYPRYLDEAMNRLGYLDQDIRLALPNIH
jgi:predicted membrane-bound spermidine synthase